MSKPSRRPGREAIKAQRKEHKKAQRKLRAEQRAQGFDVPSSATISNAKCPCKTVEEEKEMRVDAVTQQIKIYRAALPVLLRRLSKIKDPRNPKKSKHKLTVLITYGILCFAFQMASRREAPRDMTRPMFMANLRSLFPELEALPHQDTLARLLEQIDVTDLEKAHLEMIGHLIRNKKFKNYVYVLEANLAFHNGMVIPLLSEILCYTQGDNDKNKQDCEQRAFKRLAERLKKSFRCLSIMVLLDGLYANGPVMEICRKNHWDFMIVLKDDSLPCVWEEVNALKDLQPENRFEQKWEDRWQRFEWVNDIEYWYTCAETKKKMKQRVHVIICEEIWEEIAP